MDRNGYNPSILQPEDEQGQCFICTRTDEKLDRHEVFGGPFRAKSKRLGLWVCLCHQRCHLDGVHRSRALAEWLKAYAEKEALEQFGWNTGDFIREFGKNYI